MPTLRLLLAASAGGDYRVSLLDHETGGELVHEILPGAAVAGAVWTPEKIREFFAGPGAGQPASQLEAIGRQLAQWLLPGTLGAEFQKRRTGGLRTLLDVQAPALADLPWELLWIDTLPCFLDPHALLARRHPGAPKTTAAWPLRVLIVVGAAAEDDIGAEAEITAIERGLHPYGYSIDREVARRPSRTDLFERLRDYRPHVLLFIGHCDTDPQGVPVLRFQSTPPDPAWNWTPLEVALDLAQGGWTPVLAILNACRTFEPAASFKLADAFMDSGCAACIAMQGDVRGDLAGVFSAAVLRGLCDRLPLDQAVGQARGEVARRTSLLQRDWAFPVLSLAGEPTQLLPPQCDCRGRASLAVDFSDVSWFADRRDERRKIGAQLRAEGPARPPQGLLVLTGPARSGKSHLVRWCLEQFAIVRDCAIRYVRAAGAGDQDFVDLLRRLRGPVTGPEALPESALDPLHWRLNALLEGRAAATWDGAPCADRGLRYDGRIATAERTVPELCDAFRAALGRAAQERPIVIVLDQFSHGGTSLEPSIMKDVLIPHLLRPMRDGQFPGVLAILVMENTECARYGVDSLVPVEDRLHVEATLSETYERLAQELFWYPSANSPAETSLAGLIGLVIQQMKLEGKNHPSIEYLERLKTTAVCLLRGEDQLRKDLGIRRMM